MEIRRYGVRKAVQAFAEILKQGHTGPVMVSKNDPISYNRIYLLYDEEYGHFKALPYADKYREEPIRPLYELLLKIDRHQLPLRIRSKSHNDPRNDLIDLSRMLEDQKLVYAAHVAMKKALLLANEDNTSERQQNVTTWLNLNPC